MEKRGKNDAVLPSVYSSKVYGIIAGVVVQKNGVVRRKINTHSSVRQKKVDK